MYKSFQKAFAPLFLVIFIDSMGYGLIIPVLLRVLMSTSENSFAIHLDEHLKNMLYGVGVALSPFAYLLAAPIVGSYSDKLGRRKILLTCLITSCIGFVLPIVGLLTGSLILIFIGRFLAGAASSSQPIAQAAITDVSEGRQKAFYLAMIAFAMTLAMVAGPLLGSFLSDAQLFHAFNNTTPFIVATILVLLAFILTLLFFKETNQNRENSLLTMREAVSAFYTMLTDKRVRILLLIFFIYEFAWSLYFQDISLYLSLAYHYRVNTTAIFITYAGIWMSLGLTIFYRIIIRYISLAQCLLFCLTVAAIGLLACGLTQKSHGQWVFIIPVSIAVGMAYPTLLAIMSDQVEKVRQGWAMGAAASMLALSWMVSGIMSGGLTNIYLQLPLQVAAGTMIIALCILLPWLLINKKLKPMRNY